MNTYDCQEAARIAEMLIAAGRARDIPAFLQAGYSTDRLAMELTAGTATAARPTAATRARGDVRAELEAVMAQRTREIEAGGKR